MDGPKNWREGWLHGWQREDREMTITDDHWLEGAIRDRIAGGVPLKVRRCVVQHFTSGASAKSSIQAMRERGVSAHLVIDRDGTIYQCRPFNLTAGHAGKSRWVDPGTGKKYEDVNLCSIGIEIANAGDDEGALSWARKQPGFASIRAIHRNGGSEREWEAFQAVQMAAVKQVTKALVERYRLDDVTSHDAISPERKNDPGPAFPMQEVREFCGFTGLPVVNHL